MHLNNERERTYMLPKWAAKSNNIPITSLLYCNQSLKTQKFLTHENNKKKQKRDTEVWIFHSWPKKGNSETYYW